MPDLKLFTLLAVTLVVPAPLRAGAASAYLAFRFGATRTLAENVVHMTPDVWMLGGRRNTEAIKQMEQEPVDFTKDGTYLTSIANTIVVLELRAGKIDPTGNLEALYFKQKQLIASFLYLSLLQDRSEISKIVTVAKNVSFGGAPAAGRGDMDVYSVILAELPPYRVSEPSADAKTRSVTYRVPIGSKGFLVKLIIVDGAWKIDTSIKTEVPLGLFFQ